MAAAIFRKNWKQFVSVPQNALLFQPNVVKLYRSIHHKEGLDVLFIKLEQQEDKKRSTY